jgi:hypothetical protein
MNLLNKIKYAICILFICGLMNQVVYAQIGDNREKLQFGVKAGANVSSIYNTKTNNFTGSPKMGFAGAVFLSIPIGKFLGFQPEIQYSQLGFVGKGSIAGSNYTYTQVTDYISVPLLLQFKPLSSLTIVGGVQYSYLVGKSDVFKTGGITTLQEQNIQNTNIRKNTLGLVGGIDFNLTPFVLALRSGYNLLNDNENGTSTTPTYKNIFVQAMLGIKI